VATICPEEHGASIATLEEKRRLEDNSEVVDTLEDIYSLTCVAPPLSTPQPIFIVLSYCIQEKDRTSQKSTLTGGVPNLVVHLIQRQRTALLKEYPTDELHQIYAVVRFFCRILQGLCEGDDDNREFCFFDSGSLLALILSSENAIDSLLSVGQTVSRARALEYRSYEVLDDGLGFGPRAR
jgi:hypothetical protein